MERPLFVVFEGLDGSGKTTVGALVGQALGATCLATPLSSLRGVRGVVDAAMTNPLARKLWYASQVLVASDTVRSEQAAGRHVVMDRYWLSTLVYSVHAGECSQLLEVECQLVVPDVTVFLKIPLALRKTRLLARGACQPHDLLGLHEAGDLALSTQYRHFSTHPMAGRFLEVAASGTETPEQLAHDIICLLR